MDNLPPGPGPTTSAPAISRRAFTVTGLTVGFAAATLPVTAQTLITTGTEGLTAGEVRIPVADGEIPAYRAMPAAGGPFPVVLVVQEIFGVHEHIKDICRRFAREGYLAVAPEMFARQGDASKYTDLQALLNEVVFKVPDAQVMSDLDAAAAWAAANGGAVGRLGVTGFCWGGRVTWAYAAHNPKLAAGVAWYGRLAFKANELQTMVPVEIAGRIGAPVLGLYGEADQGIPVADVETMRAALKAAGKSDSEIVLYPGAPHGFFADYRPSYTEAAAKDAWTRCLGWFRKHLA